jgi:hypothetical protein
MCVLLSSSLTVLLEGMQTKFRSHSGVRNSFWGEQVMSVLCLFMLCLIVQTAVTFLGVCYKCYLSANISNDVFKLRTQNRSIIHREVWLINNNVSKFFHEEKPNENLKYLVDKATKHANAATRKSEARMYKIRKEVNMASISRKKLVTW